MEEPRLIITEVGLRAAALTMIEARGQSQDDFADFPEEWEACVANSEGDLEAALEVLGVQVAGE